VHERNQVAPVGIKRVACQASSSHSASAKASICDPSGMPRRAGQRGAWAAYKSKLRYSAFFTQQTGDKTMRWIQKISLCLGLGAVAMASVAHAQQQQFVNVLTGGKAACTTRSG
jgi:hypothetical protein